MTIKRQLLSVLLLLFFGNFAAHAKVQVVALSELTPEQKHIRASELIAHILSTYHYKKTALDDDLSSSIYDNYLKILDQNKIYFLASDIKAFEKYRYTIDNAINQADLSPAFDIFKRYRQRVHERIEFAVARVQDDFNFALDEVYRFDRKDDAWVTSNAALDELWRKRVKNDVLNLKLADKPLDEIKTTLVKRYKRIETSVLQINANDIFQSFINAYTTSIEPHTAYFSPRTSENFDISMRLSLEGIGAVLTSDNDYTKIVKIITGGPADLSKQINVDDKIIGVGQAGAEMIDVVGWRLDDVVEMIRGTKGTQVNLEILPKNTGIEGPSKTIALTRDTIKLEEQAASSSVITMPNTNRIGVITLPTFYIDFAAKSQGQEDYKSTSRDVRDLIQSLLKDNIDGLVVDLRGNSGGSLAEALELTGLFIDRGPIVQTQDASGNININYDPEDGIEYQGPLAVLVDRNSASAAEIFAGAIQDYRRGIIIGEPTFGKGTVQNIIDLNRFIKENNDDHGRLKITIAQFFRISGDSNQFKGVEPDIIFPTKTAAADNGERAYDNALPWNQISPARYYPANAPINDFIVAKEAHEKRIKNNTLFQLLLKNDALEQQVIDRKELSLLKTNRQTEREQLLMTKKAIQNAMRAEQGLPPLADDDDVADASDDDDEEKIDVLLNESAAILNDLIKNTKQQT